MALTPATTKVLSTKVLEEGGLKFLEYPEWGYIYFAFNELKEYAMGADITKQLLPQAQGLLSGANPGTEFFMQINDIVSNLWQSHLHFLNYADDWYVYIDTFDYLKKNHLGVFQDIYLDYHQAIYDCIQRKIDRLEAGKNVKHLRHKQSHDLTEAGYEKKMKYVERYISASKNAQMISEKYLKQMKKEEQEEYKKNKKFFDWVKTLSEQEQYKLAHKLAQLIAKIIFGF